MPGAERRAAARDVRGGMAASSESRWGPLARPLRKHGIDVVHEPLVLHAAAGRDPLAALAEAWRERPDVLGLTINHAMEESVGLAMARVEGGDAGGPRRARRPARDVPGGGAGGDAAVDAVVRFEARLRFRCASTG